MILPPPLLFPVSTAFLKVALIDFNLVETRSFVIESSHYYEGTFHLQTQDNFAKLRLYLFILRAF